MYQTLQLNTSPYTF